MTPTLDHGIGLLGSALDYTGAVLRALERLAPPLSSPTPCSEWSLGLLLAHMDDALDAFAEGAVGEVALDPGMPVPVRVASLRSKACALLERWSTERPDVVRIAEYALPGSVVAMGAGLEITVHGWDVGRSIGYPEAIPEPLAADLLTVAGDLVGDGDDRVTRFAAPLSVAPSVTTETRLLAFLGRDNNRRLAAAG